MEIAPLREVPAVDAPAVKTCPACAEEVRAEAAVCRFCGHRFGKRQEPGDTNRIAVLGAIAAAATLIIPIFGLAALIAAVILAVRGRVLVGAAILLVSVLAFSVWATAVSEAATPRRCGHLPVDNGFPGVRQIRGYDVICRKARRVARAVQRDWQETGGPVTLTRADGQLWECRYREVTRRDIRFIRARCWQARNAARVVRMKLVS